MTDVVNDAGVTNQVGLVLRRSPAFLWLRHVITAPEAGAVMSVVFRDDQFIPIQGHYSSTWRGDVEKAGAGTLLEHSVHDIDMLEFLVDRIDMVSARSASFHGITGIEDAMAVSFSFASGAVGTLTSIWHDVLSRPSLRRVEVFCERRWAVLEGDDWFGPVRVDRQRRHARPPRGRRARGGGAAAARRPREPRRGVHRGSSAGRAGHARLRHRAACTRGCRCDLPIGSDQLAPSSIG